jgi:hypothetical protein
MTKFDSHSFIRFCCCCCCCCDSSRFICTAFEDRLQMLMRHLVAIRVRWQYFSFSIDQIRRDENKSCLIFLTTSIYIMLQQCIVGEKIVHVNEHKCFRQGTFQLLTYKQMVLLQLILVFLH